MAKIEITDESADILLKDILVQDYTFLWKDIKRFEQKIASGEKLKTYELEDLDNWRSLVTAFDTILDYYLVWSEAKKVKDSVKLL